MSKNNTDRDNWIKFIHDKYAPRRQAMLEAMWADELEIQTEQYKGIGRAAKRTPIYPETLDKLARDVGLTERDPLYHELYARARNLMWSMDWPLVHQAMEEERGWKNPHPTQGDKTTPSRKLDVSKVTRGLDPAQEAHTLAEYFMQIATTRYHPKPTSGLKQTITEETWQSLKTAEQNIYERLNKPSQAELLRRIFEGRNFSFNDTLKRVYQISTGDTFPPSHTGPNAIQKILDYLNLSDEEFSRAETLYHEQRNSFLDSIMNEKTLVDRASDCSKMPQL